LRNMKIDGQKLFEFKEAFKKDYGLVLNEEETKEAAENLVNFFDLLWRWDTEDRQKAKEMEVKKNGKRISYPRFI